MTEACIIAPGRAGNHGYARFTSNGRTRLAHRAAYERAFGAIPDGLYVLHRCDVKRCINPAHLFLGTHADNMADMAQKGRAARTNVKLSDAEVREIRRLAGTGLSQRAIARRFAVHQGTVWPILAGRTWAHVI